MWVGLLWSVEGSDRTKHLHPLPPPPPAPFGAELQHQLSPGCPACQPTPLMLDLLAFTTAWRAVYTHTYTVVVVVVVQSLSHVQLFATPCTPCTPGFPAFHYLLKFAQIHVHWVSDAISPSHPLPHKCIHILLAPFLGEPWLKQQLSFGIPM